MSRWRARRAIGIALLCAALAACSSEVVASGSRADARGPRGTPPASAFFADPLLSHVTLSPDGKLVAAVFAREGVAMLIARPTRGGEIQRLAKLDEPGVALRSLRWSGNERILVALDVPGRAGHAREVRLLAVPLTGKPKNLGEQWLNPQPARHEDLVIGAVPGEADRVLIHYWPDPSGASASLLDVETGVLDVVVPAKRGVQRWFADTKGRVRAGEGVGERDTSWAVYARADDDDEFTEVAAYDRLREDGVAFAGFGSASDQLYVLAPTAAGRTGLFPYDLAGRALGPPLYADPAHDVVGVLRSPSTGRLLGVELAGGPPSLHFVDEAAGREQAAIDRAFPGAVSRITSIDGDEKTAIVAVSGDTRPPEYYVLNRAQKQMDELFAAYPEIDVKWLSPTQSVSYPARDGLAIQAYLTVPRAGQGRKVPAIVVVHDGPDARVDGGWDATAQFLASRGFAVLQPNFRGSTGAGYAFARAGREWGLAMQDDLADAASWLVKQGIADAGRIGIYGVGYGGYAALEGLAKAPDVFRAGASWGGWTDLALAGEGAPVSADADALAARSPARHVDRIRAPVLIAHGTRDPVVPVEQAKAMIDALEEAKKPVESSLYRDELHAFVDERNRIDFAEKLAAFFAQHLAARP